MRSDLSVTANRRTYVIAYGYRFIELILDLLGEVFLHKELDRLTVLVLKDRLKHQFDYADLYNIVGVHIPWVATVGEERGKG